MSTVKLDMVFLFTVDADKNKIYLSEIIIDFVAVNMSFCSSFISVLKVHKNNQYMDPCRAFLERRLIVWIAIMNEKTNKYVYYGKLYKAYY